VVTDQVLGAVFRVDPVTGDRTILSDVNTGSGPGFGNPIGIAVEAAGSLVVVDFVLGAVFRVDPVTGNRTILSDASTGSGPGFGSPIHIAVEADGSLVVVDFVLGAVFRVDPVTGDRTVIDCPSPSSQLLPGDCNQDGAVDLSDGIAFLNWFFLGAELSSATAGSDLCIVDATGATAVGLQIMDWTGEGALDLSDGVGLLTWFFSGGAEHDLGQACIVTQSPECISSCVDSP